MQKEDLIIRKSFSISHNNGVIWGENSDALYDFEEVVESKFSEDMKTIKKPSSPSAIAMNLNQTAITKRLAAMIIENLIEAGFGVRKVAFVGLEKEHLHNMKQAIKNQSTGFVYRFFGNFVAAKDWLI